MHMILDVRRYVLSRRCNLQTEIMPLLGKRCLFSMHCIVDVEHTVEMVCAKCVVNDQVSKSELLITCVRSEPIIMSFSSLILYSRYQYCQ